MRVKSEIILIDWLESEQDLAIANARNTRAEIFVHTHFWDSQALLIPNKISSRVMHESGDEDVSGFHEYKVTKF